MTEKKWKFLIAKARGMSLRKTNKLRMQVAEVAINACEIERGGNSNIRFSVARFAREIDLAKSTLHDWLRMKQQVVDKLPVKVREKINDIPYTTLDSILIKVDKDMTTRQVRMIFKEELSINPAILKIKKYKSHINGLLFNAKNPQYLIDIPDQLILDCVQLCQLTANLLKKELEYRKKHGTLTLLDNEEKIAKAVKAAEDIFQYR